MFIVSDDVLAYLVCSNCKKYISARPVKIYPDRSIKCGRCSTYCLGTNSLFMILAEGALFKCINRFDGCNQLLTHSQVRLHEKFTCKGKSKHEYECPVCTETFKSSLYYMYRHFKEEHPKLFLESTAMFTVDLAAEQQRTYLYCKNDLLFFVRIRYRKSEEEFTLNTLHLGSEENALKILQKLTLETPDQEIKYTVRGNRCSAIKGNEFEKKIQICVDEFPSNVVVCKLNLNTEHVETMLMVPVKDIAFSLSTKSLMERLKPFKFT